MRWRSASGLLLATLAIVASVALPTAAAASGRQEAPSPTPATGPTMRLLSQPVAVAPDGSFPALVEISGAPAATEVAVDIYGPAQATDLIGIEPATDPEATFEVIPLEEEVDGRRLVGFTIELYTEGQPNPNPPWSTQIDEPGVYPVGIRLRDDDGDITQLTTSLIRLPEADQQVEATNAALLVGVHRPPPADPDERTTTEGVDADLLDELGPVLSAFDERPDLPATFSVTPDTAARLAADGDGAPTLGLLRSALDGDDRVLLDAPYVDIDAASLVDAGLAGELTSQRDLGRTTLEALLEEVSVGTWQVHDRVDEATLSDLRQRGIYRLLVPGDALDGGAGTRAPAIAVAGEGTVTASSASQLYTLGGGEGDDPVLAAHLLLGRLAATASGPTPASVVVPVDPALASEESLQIVLDALRLGTPFFQATTIDQVLGGAPTTDPTLAPVTAQPLGPYPFDLRRSRADLTSYESMVGERPDLLAPYERRLAVSAAADLPLDERVRDARSVSAQLQTPFSAVSLPEKDTITIASRDAQVPVVITSDLDYPVQVVIELEASERLDLPADRIETTLESERTEVTIDVRARTTGDTPMRIFVRSPDDGVTLAESSYTIRSTAVSGVGIFLTVGAAGFLALWWGRNWRRSRTSAREERTRPTV